MDERVKKALDNHKKGYNCCQAVACAYSDAVQMDEEILFRMAEGFGAGMGGMQSTCGAVSGAIMVAGLLTSEGTNKTNTKGKTYKLSNKILEDFADKNGSFVCKELKGIGTKKVLRSCDGCIEDAVKIASDILFQEKGK